MDDQDKNSDGDFMYGTQACFYFPVAYFDRHFTMCIFIKTSLHKFTEDMLKVETQRCL